MRTLKKILILPFLFLLFTAAAQDASDCNYERNAHEIGLLGGASYYMGSFNPNLTPLKSPSWYAGMLYRYNFKRYFAARGQLGFGTLRGTGEGMSGLSFDPAGNNWEFNRPWIFFDVMAEFNFMTYNAVDIRKKQRFTPVLMLGVGASYLLPSTVNPAYPHYNNSDRGASPLILDIPVGIGFKWCFMPRVTLGAEWIWRISFHNEVDYYKDIAPTSPPDINDDWMGTIGITLSYLIKQTVPCAASSVYKPSKRKYRGTIND